VIGGSRYYSHRSTQKDIMIGYTFLRREYWGSGYNREAKHLMLTHIYQWVNTVYFSIGINNTRSRMALLKIGGALLTPEQQIERKMIVTRSVIYGLRRDNFKELI
jgi:N-acetyltransferase